MRRQHTSLCPARVPVTHCNRLPLWLMMILDLGRSSNIWIRLILWGAHLTKSGCPVALQSGSPQRVHSMGKTSELWGFGQSRARWPNLLHRKHRDLPTASKCNPEASSWRRKKVLSILLICLSTTEWSLLHDRTLQLPFFKGSRSSLNLLISQEEASHCYKTVQQQMPSSSGLEIHQLAIWPALDERLGTKFKWPMLSIFDVDGDVLLGQLKSVWPKPAHKLHGFWILALWQSLEKWPDCPQLKHFFAEAVVSSFRLVKYLHFQHCNFTANRQLWPSKL